MYKNIRVSAKNFRIVLEKRIIIDLIEWLPLIVTDYLIYILDKQLIDKRIKTDDYNQEKC